MIIELKIATRETGPINSDSVKIGKERKQLAQDTRNVGLMDKRGVKEVGLQCRRFSCVFCLQNSLLHKIEKAETFIIVKYNVFVLPI